MRPIPGARYVVAQAFAAMSGKIYEVGMVFELVEETTENPFGFQSKISNWFVKCPYFTPPEPESVWSSIWIMIERGQLVPENAETSTAARRCFHDDEALS